MNDKMIEEMAKVIIQASCKGRECETCAFTQIVEVEDAPETCFCLKALYNAGYRKLPEGSVVLSKNEYEELNVTGKYFNDALKQVRKETAKEFAEKLKNEIRNVVFISKDEIMNWDIIIDEIAKQYGVVEE